CAPPRGEADGADAGSCEGRSGSPRRPAGEAGSGRPPSPRVRYSRRPSARVPSRRAASQSLNRPRLAFGPRRTGGRDRLEEAFVKFFAEAAGFAVSVAAIWALVHSPVARRVVAAPREDRWHRQTTPLLGGVGIFLGF